MKISEKTIPGVDLDAIPGPEELEKERLQQAAERRLELTLSLNFESAAGRIAAFEPDMPPAIYREVGGCRVMLQVGSRYFLRLHHALSMSILLTETPSGVEVAALVSGEGAYRGTEDLGAARAWLKDLKKHLESR